MTSQEDADQNAAASADGTSLASLFSKDPMELTASERQQIIDAERQKRQRFLEAEQAPKKKAASKKTASKQAASKQVPPELGDLDIDI